MEKIIHQTWKTKDIPFDVYKREWVASWAERHPGWEYRLWTDEDNRCLIKEQFPWFLKTYDNYPAAINRVDAIRYFILYAYGGVYVDLDYLCLKNLEPLLAGYDLVLTYTGRDKAFAHSISNAIMASSKGMSLWPEVFKRMQKARGDKTIVEFRTGPALLRDAVKSFVQRQALCSFFKVPIKEKVKVCEPEVLCPIDPRQYSIHKGSLPQKMQDDPAGSFPEAYAVTFWAHHWQDPYYMNKESN